LPAAWPDVKPGTSLAGVIGGAVTLALVMAVGFALRRRRSRD
jgi:CDP-diglyceride synthetase